MKPTELKRDCQVSVRMNRKVKRLLAQHGHTAQTIVNEFINHKLGIDRHYKFKIKKGKNK